MAVVPYTFANQSGQIPLSELDANFANVKAFAETAGNVTGNVQSNITSVGTLNSLTVSGNVTATTFVGNVVGNISGNLTVQGSNTQVLFNDNGLANATAGMTFNKSSNAFVVTGNTTAANITTAGTLTAGAITATGNVRVNGQVIAGGSIIGQGIQSNSGNIGVPAGVTTLRLGNAGPDTVWLGGSASNVYVANANSTTQILGNLSAGGDISAAGNVSSGNLIISGIATVTGNVTGGNVSTAGAITATGNITGGNLSIGGTSSLIGVATAPTAANGTSNTQIATTAFVTNTVINRIPTGVITLWYGSIASVPAGWALCDGGNGTPDLRDRFVVGAGTSYAVAATGGSADAIVVSHTHTATSSVTDPGHSHQYNDTLLQADFFGTGANASTATANTTSSNVTGITVSTTVNSTGSSGTNANLPPYYALAYIMKL